jgi:PAS domain S-box-containing protein
VAPHLAPDQPSVLIDLIGKHARVPVGAATDGAAPQADHVYVARPGEGLSLRGGRMRIEHLQGTAMSRAAMDALLLSLAEDLGAAALGVVLSGSGEAGVKGLRAIVDAGGFTVAQSPDSADYGDMPQAAIDAGVADQALPPAAIPEALLEHTRPGSGKAVLEEFSNEPSEQSALRRLLALLRVRTRYDFRDYRPSMVGRRIRRRMDQLGVANGDQYLAQLRSDPAELEQLYHDLMIGVTGFFRDDEAFAALQEHVIEPLVQRHAGDVPLRVWVPGCASGEEAYSIGILLLEAFGAGGRAANVQVFATDIDEVALERARQGIYTETAMQGLSRDRRERFFVRLGGGRQQVGKALREIVVFAVQNLLRDAPFSRIDLISCRNVLIYLKPQAQEQVIARFHFALRPGGYLFLGSAEAVGKHADMFETVSKRWRVFRRIGESRGDLVGIAATGMRPTPYPAELRPAPQPQQGGSFKDTARRALCDLFAPAAVLVNSHYDILYYHGATADYLEFPSGEPTRAMTDMLRKGLLSPVRGACQTALGNDKPVRVRDAKVLRGDIQVPVEVLVHPVRESRLAERLLLVSFRDRGSGEAPPGTQEPEEHAVDDLTTVEQLEFELRATREDLRSTIEELQSANEQLKAANEEVTSTNEEMQSANEELQTSKEELQSVNEELATVNSQMQEKVAELEQRNDDIHNLLASSHAITVFLDRDLRIKLFTQASKPLLNIRRGRPLAELSSRVHDTHLVGDCRAVLDTLTPLERQVGDDDGRRWLRRVVPYRSQEDRIEGVVVTLVDITAQTDAEMALRASERHYRRLFEDAPIQMLEQNWSRVAALVRDKGQAAADPRFFEHQPELLAACRDAIRITAVNGAARALLGIADDADVERLRPDFCCTRELGGLIAGFVGGRRLGLCEDEIKTASGRTRPMLCQFAVMPGSEASLERVLVLLLDLSEQKALERKLADSEKRLRRALRVVHESVWEYDFARDALWWSDEYERQFGKPMPMRQSVPDWWAQGIHPDDQDGARARLQEAIDAEADEWRAEYRRRGADGRYVSVMARGAIDRDPEGRMVRMLGCMLDVSDLKAAQEGLAERETRLRSILEAAAEAIITTDADGRIEQVNQAAEAMFRCSAEDVFGQPIRELFASMDGRQVDPLKSLQDDQPRLLHGRRAHGETLPLELSARFVPEHDLWVLVGRDVSERRRLERDVIELSTRQQEELGREIHDGLGQELTALVMLAHSMRQQQARSGPPKSDEAFGQLEQYLRHALETCRTIARGLSAQVTAPGLENTLAELAAGMERAAGVPCRFSYNGPSGSIEEQQAPHLYRIAQEAISNALRHSQASRVDLSLEVGDDELVLRIRDDGQGIPPGARRGLGLRLMVYRAGMLGGTSTFDNPDSGGTLVECRVPRLR